MGREPHPRSRHFRVPGSLARLASLRADLRAFLRNGGVEESAIYDVVLATHEAAVNGIVHGNGGDATRSVEVTVDLEAGDVVVQVSDEGCGFDWRNWLERARARATVPEALSGRGILVMASVMDDVAFSPQGNSVRLVKRLGA
jgi:serine/threonine-protein kinase RsbW